MRCGEVAAPVGVAGRLDAGDRAVLDEHVRAPAGRARRPSGRRRRTAGRSRRRRCGRSARAARSPVGRAAPAARRRLRGACSRPGAARRPPHSTRGRVASRRPSPASRRSWRTSSGNVRQRSTEPSPSWRNTNGERSSAPATRAVDADLQFAASDDQLLGRRSRPLPEDEALDLAGRRLRQGVDDPVAPRSLEPGELGLAEHLQLRLVDRSTRAWPRRRRPAAAARRRRGSRRRPPRAPRDCRTRTASTSAGETHSPPTRIMSSLRPRYV